MPSKHVDDVAHRPTIEVECFQFPALGAASGVVRVFVDSDQAQQDLAGGIAPVVRQISIHLLGAAAQRAGDSTDSVVINVVLPSNPTDFSMEAISRVFGSDMEIESITTTSSS